MELKAASDLKGRVRGDVILQDDERTTTLVRSTTR